MRRRLRFFAVISGLLASVAGGILISPLFRAASAQQNGAQLSAAAQRQIAALLAEKNSRSSAEKKLDSQLLYAIKARRGDPVTSGGEVRSLRTAEGIAKTDAQDRVLVDIKGDPAKQVIESIGKVGGEVVYANLRAGSVRARIPFNSLEALASVSAVKSVRPPAMPKTQRQLTGPRGARLNPTASAFRVSQPLQAGMLPDFHQRAMNIRTQLSSALARAGAATLNRSTVARELQGPVTNAGAVTSQGDRAHRAAEARNFFGVTGAGVKIGVLSDSVDFLARSIASGDLPPDVTVLPGQSGLP
jgi:hypothetical protein